MTTLLVPDQPPALGPAAPPTTEPPSHRRRRLRLALLALVALVAIVALSLLAGAKPASTQPGDPDNPHRTGMRAVAEVLRQHDVEVDVVHGITDLEATSVDANTTVVVSAPSNLGPGAAERLSEHVSGIRRLVLIDPSDLTLSDLGLPLMASGDAEGPITAKCSSSVADPSDELLGDASTYVTEPAIVASAVTCFAAGEVDDATGSRPAALIVLAARSGSPETVVFGSPTAFANAWVTDGAHAALALRSLGPAPRLVWYMPTFTDLSEPGLDGAAPDPDRGIPEWFAPGALLLAITFVAFAFTRGRRLGRAVVEPLPVVVRAVETTEARGRLYRRAGDAERAATVLREGTRTRLAARIGLSPHASPATIGALVARLSGREPAEIHELLNGHTPANDHDLLLLAQQLTDLEESVRRA